MSSLHIRSLGEPPESIWALTAAQVRDLAASLSPTPGGGSISVFTATLGLALVHKGASISLKRAGEDVMRRDALTPLCDQVNAALVSMSGLADDDANAFRDYLKARTLPQTTEEEKAARSEAMEAAILHAIRVPIASAKEICAALKHAETAVTLCDDHLLTDVFGGALMMQAAARAVLLTLGTNVSLLSDETTRAEIEKERFDLERSSVERADLVSRAYEARISR